MSKLILVDIDGVVLDWVASFKDFMIDLGHKPVKENPSSYCFSNWFNLDSKEILELIYQFNESENFSNLEALGKSRDILLKLRNEHDFSFVAITKCGRELSKKREINLNQVLGEDFFSEIHCLDFDECKKELLAKYPSSYWIEDNYKNALIGLEVGHRSVLINTSYNQVNCNNPILRVDCWNSIYDILTSELYKKVG
jgi:uncharacterized HAD superfamily protein